MTQPQRRPSRRARCQGGAGRLLRSLPLQCKQRGRPDQARSALVVRRHRHTWHWPCAWRQDRTLEAKALSRSGSSSSSTRLGAAEAPHGHFDSICGYPGEGPAAGEEEPRAAEPMQGEAEQQLYQRSHAEAESICCQFEWYTSATTKVGVCAACGKQWSRGSRLYCRLECRRATCSGCRGKVQGHCPFAMTRPPAPTRDQGQVSIWQAFGAEEPAEVAAEAEADRWWASKLLEAIAEPAPPTMRQVPAKAKRRVLDLLLRALDEAVTATELEQDEDAQLEAHRRLWLMPSLLPAAPSDPAGARAEQEEDDDFKGQGATLAVLRRCLKRAQEGDWESLLDAHLRRLERARRRAARQSSDTVQHAEDEEAQQKQWTKRVIAKAKGGCLRTAARLVIGGEHAPHSDESAKATADLVVVEPVAGDGGGHESHYPPHLAQAASQGQACRPESRPLEGEDDEGRSRARAKWPPEQLCPGHCLGCERLGDNGSGVSHMGGRQAATCSCSPLGAGSDGRIHEDERRSQTHRIGRSVAEEGRGAAPGNRGATAEEDA